MSDGIKLLLAILLVCGPGILMLVVGVIFHQRLITKHARLTALAENLLLREQQLTKWQNELLELLLAIIESSGLRASLPSELRQPKPPSLLAAAVGGVTARG